MATSTKKGTKRKMSIKNRITHYQSLLNMIQPNSFSGRRNSNDLTHQQQQLKTVDQSSNTTNTINTTNTTTRRTSSRRRSKTFIRPKLPEYNENGQQVYCVCRQPDDEDFMIECDTCKDWFHGHCVGVNEKDGGLLDVFVCEQCENFIIEHYKPNSDSIVNDAISVEEVKLKKESDDEKTLNGSNEQEPSSNQKEESLNIVPDRDDDEYKVDKEQGDTDNNDGNDDEPLSKRKMSATNSSSNPLSSTTISVTQFYKKDGVVENIPDSSLGSPALASAAECSTVASTPTSSSESIGIIKSRTAKRKSSSSLSGSKNTPTTNFISSDNNRKLKHVTSTSSSKDNLLRNKVKYGLTETVDSIFKWAKDEQTTKDILKYADIQLDLNDPSRFAVELEENIFKYFATFSSGNEGQLVCGDKYKSKYRSLQFNLKDEKNMRLRKNILSGEWTAEILVQMSPEDMANEHVLELAAQVRKESIQQSVKVKESDSIKPQLDLLFPQGYDSNLKSVDSVLYQQEIFVDRNKLDGIAVDDEQQLSENQKDILEMDTSQSSSMEVGDSNESISVTTGDQLDVKPVSDSSTNKRSSDEEVLNETNKKLKITSSMASGNIEENQEKVEEYQGGDDGDKNKEDKVQQQDEAHHNPLLNENKYDFDMSDDGEYHDYLGQEEYRTDMEVDSVHSPHKPVDSPPLPSTGNPLLSGFKTHGGYHQNSKLENEEEEYRPDDDDQIDRILQEQALEEQQQQFKSVKQDFTVWKGLIHMPQVARFSGYVEQVAGEPVGGTRVWEDILPGTLTITGRISTDRVSEYILAQKVSTSKEIVVIEVKPISPTSREDNYAKEEVDIQDEQEFKTLFEYFYSRARLAVVANSYVSVKDMYIVPLAAKDEIPEFLSFVTPNDISKERDRDALFGVIILVKDVIRGGRQSDMNALSSSTVPGAQTLLAPKIMDISNPFFEQTNQQSSGYPTFHESLLTSASSNPELSYDPFHYPITTASNTNLIAATTSAAPSTIHATTMAAQPNSRCTSHPLQSLPSTTAITTNLPTNVNVQSLQTILQQLQTTTNGVNNNDYHPPAQPSHPFQHNASHHQQQYPHSTDFSSREYNRPRHYGHRPSHNGYHHKRRDYSNSSNYRQHDHHRENGSGYGNEDYKNNRRRRN